MVDTAPDQEVIAEETELMPYDQLQAALQAAQAQIEEQRNQLLRIRATDPGSAVVVTPACAGLSFGFARRPPPTRPAIAI